MDVFDALVEAEIAELNGTAQKGVGAYLPGVGPLDNVTSQHGDQMARGAEKAGKGLGWMAAALVAWVMFMGWRRSRG
ncbi:hypothetical protein OAU50_04450 [Planctomycetota bacterium]|nr:hypothetical protein [Planctomycetota bacterium]